MAWRPSSDDVRARADAALLRASRAALAAELQEQRAGAAPEPLREIHRTLARFHRETQVRHQTAAALQLAHADRMSFWEAGLDPARTGRPALLTCVGDVVGADSAVTLHDADDRPALIATSGPLARLAVQLELVLGEGPTHDCTTHGRAVSAASPVDTWPTYGAAAAGLGVGSVQANPLAAGGRHLGVLTTFNTPRTGPDGGAVHLPTLAAAVTETLLEHAPRPGSGASGWETLGPPGHDAAAVLHCASGMVSADRGCSPEEALSVILARADATGEQVETVAHGILAPGGLSDL